MTTLHTNESTRSEVAVERTRRAAGYAETAIGVLPADWEVSRLGDLVELKTGPFGSLLHKSDYIRDGVPLVNPIHMSDGHILPDTSTTVTKAAAERMSEFQLRAGDVVVARRGEMGRSAVVLDEQQGWICGTGSMILRPRDNVDPTFLQGVFSSPAIVSRITDASVGSTMVNLNHRTLAGLLVQVPEYDEQRAIAGAVSHVDGLIAALEKLIAKKQAMKQASMQQLLTGRTRLPGFTGKWTSTTLGEVAEIKNGATPSTHVSAFWGGVIPWCTPTDVTGTPGKYLFTTERSITQLGLASCNASLLPPGTLLLCSRATIGEVKIAATDICTNQGFKSLVSRTGISNDFLYYIVLILKPKLLERAIGSTFLEIGKRDLASVPIMLPKEDEQTAIANVLSDMDAEIEKLELRRNKTKQIKQSMMQQLLPGRSRLAQPQNSAMRVGAKRKGTSAHSWAFNEAVVISTLAKKFGSEQFPLGRKRYTKLSYLLHRHVENQAKGYLKKAAGPYNPGTRYGGPERLALESNYIREHKNGPYRGFVGAENIAQAEAYFEKWYGADRVRWLEQFRFIKNDELEVLATVDMAAEDLRAAGQRVDVDTVKDLIRGHEEWRAKLSRKAFSDVGIKKAIETARKLFA